jgi:hypothetical protein
MLALITARSRELIRLRHPGRRGGLPLGNCGQMYREAYLDVSSDQQDEIVLEDEPKAFMIYMVIKLLQASAWNNKIGRRLVSAEVLDRGVCKA